jgi:hypothetical protein
MGYKKLEYFEFSKSLFLNFENDVKYEYFVIIFKTGFSKIKNNDIENLKYQIFCIM